MAEVFGIVASGLSVAQIAGSILNSSFKLKTLLDEVRDAPANLRLMLDHLELLTPILSDATTVSTQPSPPSNHQQALQKALGACQRAAEQLELLVTELASNITAASGGARRKRFIGAVKVVLKKGILAQHEMRLQNAIQLLTFAQNTYIV
ncbi:hypothetical protein DHEL01_v205757 [Diaporthe helianthi]|uniref:NACHT-NTPase and P-loop NTPases N-terminal domain-containing protein n=1 Tax=Diaporthe helianthi TaxID=158607 RepID=A0A2P5I034_DIAHE|nr:hypothetical protein DHEL01_v205757 [Diaporthe helianthi]